MLNNRTPLAERIINDALIVLAAFVVGALFLVIVATGTANAAGPVTTEVVAYGDTSLVVNRHNVVVASTLRHCPLEDGGPRIKALGPCTWNVGSTDGNGAGLAYVLFRGDTYSHDLQAIYVWANDPTGHGWHWIGQTDCVRKAGVNRVRCSDGNI